MRCKHGDVFLNWERGTANCVRCGELLSLGLANDADEAVKIEKEAAARAAIWRDEHYTPGADRFEWCMTTRSDELCALCDAHYLAHCIATHDEAGGK